MLQATEPTVTSPWPADLLPPGSFSADGHGLQWQPAGAAGADLARGVFCPLPDYGLLTVSGADAASFLHGQLTNDVEHLSVGMVRWNGYCTAKGRLLSVFLNWRDADRVYLTASSAQTGALSKRLSMYVMRSKAKVEDASASRAGVGLLGCDLAPVLAALGITEPPSPMTVAWNSASGLLAAAQLAAVALPGLALQPGEPALQRVMLWVQADALPAVLERLRESLQPAASACWRWTEIRCAVPRVFAATAEQFVPQMVNLELVDGVSFKKGCYPGQEIVARSQYLGKLKRRMFLGQVAGPAQPGQDVLAADGQPCGMVVMSATAPGAAPDSCELLFEAQLSATEPGPVSVGGLPVILLALPYQIPPSVKAG